MRHSLSLLETHLSRASAVPRSDGQLTLSIPAHDPLAASNHSNSDPSEKHVSKDKCTPGTFGAQTNAGFYAGPTSSAAQLGNVKVRIK
jgi:hypothetical protein